MPEIHRESELYQREHSLVSSLLVYTLTMYIYVAIKSVYPQQAYTFSHFFCFLFVHIYGCFVVECFIFMCIHY